MEKKWAPPPPPLVGKTSLFPPRRIKGIHSYQKSFLTNITLFIIELKVKKKNTLPLGVGNIYRGSSEFSFWYFLERCFYLILLIKGSHVRKVYRRKAGSSSGDPLRGPLWVSFYLISRIFFLLREKLLYWRGRVILGQFKAKKSCFLELSLKCPNIFFWLLRIALE